MYFTTFIPAACGGQRRELDTLDLELQTVVKSCGSWKLDLGPLEKQAMPLPAEPLLQAHNFYSGNAGD